MTRKHLNLSRLGRVMGVGKIPCCQFGLGSDHIIPSSSVGGSGFAVFISPA